MRRHLDLARSLATLLLIGFAIALGVRDAWVKLSAWWP